MEKQIKTNDITLRQRAKAHQKKQSVSVNKLSETELLKIVPELEVHQIELEMQNEELRTAKLQLEHVSNDYKELYDFAPSANFTLSRDGEIIELNFCGALLLGKERPDIKNSSFCFFVATDSKPEFNLFLARIFSSKTKETCELWLSIIDKSPTYVHLSGVASGNGEHCQLIAIEISNRKQAEESLLASETRYRRLFESAKDGILILDAETGRIMDVNPFLIGLLGYSKEKFIEKEIWEIGFFKDIVANYDKFLELQQKEYVRYDDLPLETVDGRKINVEFVSNVYLVDNKKVIQCNIRDITKRKQAELALLNSETHLRTLVQTIPDLIWLKNTNGVYLSCNLTFGRFFGAGEAEIVGKTDYDFVDRELADFFRKNDRKAMEAGKPTINEEWVSYADDGHQVFLETIKTPMYDSNGILLGVLGIGRDITDRKHAEESIKKQKDEFETIFNLVPAQIWYKDTHNNFIRVNRQVCSDIGMINDKIEGHSAEELFPSFAQQYFKDDLEVFNTRMSKLGIIEQLNTSKGEIRWVNTDKIPVFGNDGEISGLIAVVQDITERKLAEKEITMLAHSLKSINECVSITDLNNNILFVNESFLNTYGYDRNELIGKNIAMVRSPSNETTMIDEILHTTTDGEWKGELLQRRKDGSEFPIYLSTTNIKDKESNVLGLIGVAIDITERKSEEKELIEAKNKAEESDRLKSAFLANMSHEVRTPLNSIIGFSELLADPDFEEETKLEFVQHIIANGNNLLNIISDIMDISKIESHEITIRKSPINVQKFCTSIQEQFVCQAKAKNIDFELDIPGIDENTIIFADADRLRQIFNNLVGNAIKFTEKGSIEISYHLRGKFVEFQIKDTGIGIPAEFHELIFERFRQVDTATTRKYGGNGLGLAISKNLIELMGGQIWIESKPCKGSVFHFTLPCEEKPESEYARCLKANSKV